MNVDIESIRARVASGWLWTEPLPDDVNPLTGLPEKRHSVLQDAQALLDALDERDREIERLRKARLCQQHYDGPNDEDYGDSTSVCVICLMNRCDRLTAQRDAVLALHRKNDHWFTVFNESFQVCAGCLSMWPCPTAHALGVES